MNQRRNFSFISYDRKLFNESFLWADICAEAVEDLESGRSHNIVYNFAVILIALDIL